MGRIKQKALNTQPFTNDWPSPTTQLHFPMGSTSGVEILPLKLQHETASCFQHKKEMVLVPENVPWCQNKRNQGKDSSKRLLEKTLIEVRKDPGASFRKQYDKRFTLPNTFSDLDHLNATAACDFHFLTQLLEMLAGIFGSYLTCPPSAINDHCREPDEYSA